MKFKIDKKRLLDELRIISMCIDSLAPVPAMSGVKINAKDGCLELIGSNGNQSMWSRIKEVNVIEEGEIVVDAKAFTSIVSKAQQDISVSTKGMSIVITSGKARQRLNGYYTGEYPDIDFSLPEIRLDIDMAILDDIINRISYAISTNPNQNNNRPVLKGLNLDCSKTSMQANSSDSYRMAMYVIDSHASSEINITVPYNALKNVLKLRGKQIDIYANDNKILFGSENEIFQTSLISGYYPDVKRIIPKEFVGKLEINKKELIDAIERTEFNLHENTNVIYLCMDENKVMIKTDETELGSTEEELEKCEYEGESMEIKLNGKFLKEALNSCLSEKAIMEFAGSQKALRINSGFDVEDNYTAIMVPLREVKR